MATPISTPDEINFTGNNNGSGQNALKRFQLSGDSRDKASEAYGKKIILQVEQIINSGYFSDRNTRFSLNRAMAAGRMNMTKFMDFFNINGKTNYVNISWKSIMIVNTIISRLVGRWMTKREKASVEAKDPISINQKKEEYATAEFVLAYKDKLAGLQDATGVEMISQNQFVPDDKDHLDLWATEEQRIPEEILYEKGINNVFSDNGFGDMGVNTRKIKHDSAEVGLVAAEVIADKHGKIICNYCKPENCFYSYSEFPDFRDSDIKGEIVSYKISQIRDMYPKTTIEELYEIAKVSKQWSASDKISFQTTWNTSMFLPFDDWNVDVVRFTLRSLDVDKNLIKTAKDGSMYVDRPKKTIEDVYPGNEYVEKTIWNIYRGVYVRQTKMILEWGLEKNMIKPQKYEQISEAKSPYHFYMYQNTQMRNLAVPEKIEEPVEQMILARLKIQQLVAGMQKSGHKYDIDGLQAMDLGNGICTPLELRKITDQTGDVYYRSRDAEGNRIENPVSENPNAGSVPQLQALIEVYNYHLSVLRDEIGINEFAEGQTIKPRVGVQNVQTSLEVSFNATDYMNDACVSLKDSMADSIACLLHDSVEFGSDAYRELMQVEDVKDREFKTSIEMLPTIDEITELDNSINKALEVQPDLALYINPEKIKRIAKDNVKLASEYFYQGQRRAIKGRAEQAKQQSDYNAKVQQDSGIAVEKEKQNTIKDEVGMKSQLEALMSKEKQKEVLLTTLGQIYAKGLQVPAELKELELQLIKNLETTLAAENANNDGVMRNAQKEDNEEQMPVDEGQPMDEAI